MKHLYRFAIASLALVSFTACDDDFLTKVPETNLSPATFFMGEQGCELYTNRFYNLLDEPAGDPETCTDIHATTSLNNIQKGTRTASSKSWTTSTFQYLRWINYFLENSEACTDETIRHKYQGVALFFRAYYYYTMVRTYGDMPYYDHVIGSSDNEALNRPRDSRAYVMMKCMEDLDKAYEYLPSTWDVYHVTKDAALALKSRIALFEGTFRKYHAGTAYVPNDEETFDGKTVSSTWFLNQAADAAEKLIGSRVLYSGNTMGLDQNPKKACYREYFLLEVADPKETILARCYSEDSQIRHGLQFDYKNKRHSATNRFVNHYLLANGKSIATVSGYETLPYAKQFENRDPRMAQTLQGPDYIQVGETEKTPVQWDRTMNGYRIIKGVGGVTWDGATTCTNDWPLFRYAEVLLNYAEAKAELGTLTDQDVAKTIDVVRNRVGMTAMATVPTTEDAIMKSYYPNAKGSQLAAILEVRRERTVELYSEGFRQWDLLRWGEGKWLTPSSTKGFRGIYIPGYGEYDMDGDGKVDIVFYPAGQKPATISAGISVANQIEISGNTSLSEGDHGFVTYFALENYEWWEERDYLSPIPADQREITQGALTQNPYWEDSTDY